METLEKMETKVTQESKSLTVLTDKLSILELVNLATEYESNSVIGHEVRQELILRGKDNIQNRISIKKFVNAAIAAVEVKLNGNKDDKNLTVKELKNKLLLSVSVLDRLQLEWQKYDLGITGVRR